MPYSASFEKEIANGEGDEEIGKETNVTRVCQLFVEV
jgi:hypothetical protein